MRKNERIALMLTAALMTGKRASEGNAERSVELYRSILARLDEVGRSLPPRSPADYEV